MFIRGIGRDARTTEPSLSTAEGIKETVRGFILSSITITQLRDDDDLFDSGIVNSLFRFN